MRCGQSLQKRCMPGAGVWRSMSTAMGFPVRTKGTGNTEHMFSQWGLWEQGTGNREQVTRRPAGPPEAKFDPAKKKFGGGESLRCVLLCFIKPILGNRYGPGVNSLRQ